MEITQKKTYKFFCEKCQYKTDKKTDYNKHILTLKHKNNINVICDKNKEKTKIFFDCICGKKYTFRASLYNHKKKCNFIEINEENFIKSSNNNSSIMLKNEEENNELKNLVCKLITENNEIKNTILKENKELRETINELIPKVGNNNRTQNNKVNIQVFLNEKCKDAINMSDFVKSIEVSLQQLDFTKRNGLESGLSKTIMDNMNKLSVYERPLHCTDVKRETLYIKDENEWTKDASKEKIKNAIKKHQERIIMHYKIGKMKIQIF